jgi:hypothetical protein
METVESIGREAEQVPSTMFFSWCLHDIMCRIMQCAARLDERRRFGDVWQAWRLLLSQKSSHKKIREKQLQDQVQMNLLSRAMRRWEQVWTEARRRGNALRMLLWMCRWKRTIEDEARRENKLCETAIMRRTLRKWRESLEDIKRRHLVNVHKTKLWSKVRDWLEEHERKGVSDDDRKE